MEPIKCKEFWSKQRVFVTGHSGFKGAWLCLMLKRLGAYVYGYSKGYPTQPALLQQIDGDTLIDVSFLGGDVVDEDDVRYHLKQANPTVVMHLAAQAIVKDGFKDPQGTFLTNTIGTGNVLNACRDVPVEAILVITTDKVYKDTSDYWAYREIDELGAADPYSTSKACAELVVDSYRKSFLQNTPLATARAGNCVGGGDWGYRVIPMIMSALMNGKVPSIWDPYATRPWQSVLDCLSGYLRLVEYAYEDPSDYSGSWNFGPDADEIYTVGEVAQRLCASWDASMEFEYVECPVRYNLNVDLRLDSSKARKVLNWRPKWNLDAIIFDLIDWYSRYWGNRRSTRSICEKSLDNYEDTICGKSL